MVDESTDRVLESHLITYVTYLEVDDIGQPKIQFLNLQALPNGTSISILEAWKKTSNKYDLVQSHIVGLATNGVASMVGVHEGFATKLKREILHLFKTHCIALREALASKDAVEAITPPTLLEKLFKRLHGWIGKYFLKNKSMTRSFKYHGDRALEDVAYSQCAMVVNVPSNGADSINYASHFILISWSKWM